MPPRQPRALPTRWLMTDERMGEALWSALRRLPRGGGVVFRHYGLPEDERAALFARVARVAQQRGLLLIRAEATPMRGEAGVHGRNEAGVLTWPAHDRAEALAGFRAGARLLFVSPVFATRSHPGARALGVARARAIGRGLGIPLVALGGMNERRFRALDGFHGYAAIDAWTRQKRKAVPT